MPIILSPLSPVAAPSLGAKTLIQMRRRFVELSGHYELVLDAEQNDWGDNGADDYIRAAQRRLDDEFTYHKSDAYLYAKLTAGQSLVTFNWARLIKQVWIADATGYRTELTRLTMREMRQLYSETTLAAITQGTPQHWSPIVSMLAPSQIGETANTFDTEDYVDYDQIVFSEAYFSKSLVVMPPPSITTTVQVLASWYSPTLSDDNDVCFWSQFPELLIRGARAELELDLHRNQTGYRGFLEGLMPRLSRLEDNLLEEEQSGPPENYRIGGV